MSDIAELLKEVKETREKILTGDAERQKVLDEIKGDIAKTGAAAGETEQKLAKIVTDLAEKETKLQGLQETINNIAKKVSRPQGEFSEEANRKAARGLLELKHLYKITKRDPEHLFSPSEDQVTEAEMAIKGMRALMHCTDIQQLSAEHRKALSSFNIGASGFILPPEMSSRVLSCLQDPTDVTGLMDNMTISSHSIRFMVDNVVLDQAAWACQQECFANNPQDIEGLGEREIKPETLRYVVCVTRDLLEDASTNIEAWLLNKVNIAFRRTISLAVLFGDGNGKPLGILNPQSGVPICDTSVNTPPGQLTWQDLVMLRWEVPMAYHLGAASASYLMNQRTFGQILTMSDASGRPILAALPTGIGTFQMNGSPINIVTQMPDVAPGSEPVAYGNWREAYMIVNRKAVTMQQDPYSAGFCILYKFEARVGGGAICPNAVRVLRIR